LFTYHEYDLARSQLAPNKAPGTDRQLSNQQKNASNTLADVTLFLMNTCIIERTQPVSWTQALVHLIYKNKGPRSNPLNYRLIALLQTIYKTYTATVNSRLITTLLHNKAISPTQAGFLRNRSTQEQVAHHITTIENA
jgi:hypothetical protein